MSSGLYYLQALLQFDRASASREVTTAYLEANIRSGLKSAFGEIGAAFPIDLLKLERSPAELTYNFILATPSVCAVKVRASLTLISSFQGHRCAYHVVRAADNLLTLSNLRPELIGLE